MTDADLQQKQKYVVQPHGYWLQQTALLENEEAC